MPNAQCRVPHAPVVQAVHRDGDFLDVGCVNGLLLES